MVQKQEQPGYDCMQGAVRNSRVSVESAIQQKEVNMSGSSVEEYTLGVEEELQLIDPVSLELCNSSTEVLKHAQAKLSEQVKLELKLSQIETATAVCRTLDELHAELVRTRAAVRWAAEQEGHAIIGTGIHPFSRWENQQLTPKERYVALLVNYQHLAREQIICGCHVHVGLPADVEHLAVLNRARPWLAPLLALSANSPFWLGEVTGYASFRTQLWSRWPLAGPPPHFASRQDYQARVQKIIASGTIQEETLLYWDARLHPRYGTLEFRVMDACVSIEDTLMLAGLIRGVTRECVQQAREQTPYAQVEHELMRLANWHAARYGLNTTLIDVTTGEAVPAHQIIEGMLEFARPALQAQGDWETVAALVQRTLDEGNGADRQRSIYEETRQIQDVVKFLATHA